MKKAKSVALIGAGKPHRLASDELLVAFRAPRAREIGLVSGVASRIANHAARRPSC